MIVTYTVFRHLSFTNSHNSNVPAIKILSAQNNFIQIYSIFDTIASKMKIFMLENKWNILNWTISELQYIHQHHTTQASIVKVATAKRF